MTIFAYAKQKKYDTELPSCHPGSQVERMYNICEALHADVTPYVFIQWSDDSKSLIVLI